MKFSSFHIDGFGALNGLHSDELAPGLVVVLGPNEAGKSTLFDFLAGVLFGFPSRKDNARFHAPQRGGRHGGRVTFLDETHGEWVVERHANPQKSLEIRLPDGTAGSENDLMRALAGANAGLFRAVFAVDLDDLGRMENLESDEVRELLFAASIFGQRRSASVAIKQLTDVRDGLARPRRDDATANRVARDLEVVRAELAAARREAGGFAAMTEQSGALEVETQAIRSRVRTAWSRERELQLLARCWPSYSQAVVARRALSTLPENSSGGSVLFDHAAEIRALSAELSGHEERAAKLSTLETTRSSIQGGVERRLALLGCGWTSERAADAPDPGVLTERLREWRTQLSRCDNEVAAAKAVLAGAEKQLETASATPPLGAGAGAHGRNEIDEAGIVELEGQAEVVLELRERLAEVERLEAAVIAEDRTPPAAVVDSARRLPGPAGALVASVAVVLTLVVGVVLLAHDRTALGVAGEVVVGVVMAIALVTVALVSVAMLVQVRSGQRSKSGSERGSSRRSPGGSVEGSSPGSHRILLQREMTTVEALALAIGLPVPVSRVDVERRCSALQRALDTRRFFDQQAGKIAEAARRADETYDLYEVAAEALHTETAGFAAWCRKNGFGPVDAGDNDRATGRARAADRPIDVDGAAYAGLAGIAIANPDDALAAIGRLAEVRERLAGLRRVEAEADGIKAVLHTFNTRCHQLLDVVGGGSSGALGSGGGSRSSHDTGAVESTAAPSTLALARSRAVDARSCVAPLRERLERLVCQLDDATAVEGQRTALQKECAAADSVLHKTIGGGSSASRLLAELAFGDVLAWEAERAELERSMEALSEEAEAAVRRHQSVTEALAELATSDRIAALEQHEAQLEVALDTALQGYLVVGAARLLLQRTLARHERERQPAVIASAATHFKRVTCGRYTRLLADPGPDGKQALRALSETGEIVDATRLSRGTLEQLYLCVRLGLADSFAERSVSLPIVLDDVLVNFDPERARTMATELAVSAQSHQIVFMTCHPELAELMMRAGSEGPATTQLIQLERIA